MTALGIAYDTYNFVFDEFTDNALPRNYEGSANFADSPNGATIVSGPAYKQKYNWVVSAYITPLNAANFQAMFEAWDSDRAAGLPAACGVVDETFGPTISANAVFVTPPSFVRLSPSMMTVNFGLREV